MRRNRSIWRLTDDVFLGGQIGVTDIAQAGFFSNAALDPVPTIVLTLHCVYNEATIV
jgi:hypothetical protein